MPSHVSADRPAPQPPERGTVDALISQTRRLRGDVDAVRRDAVVDDDDPQGRWQRALCDLAVHHLDDLGNHLGQLKEGLPDEVVDAVEDELAAHEADHAQRTGSLLSRVGSAEWNLLTDEVDWSDELYQILGRSPQSGPHVPGRAALHGLRGGPGAADRDGARTAWSTAARSTASSASSGPTAGSVRCT